MPIVNNEIRQLTLDGDISFGRQRIYTELDITEGNIKQILNDALTIHNKNVMEMEKLINYYLGKQEILYRQTPYSSDVNNKVIINYAQSVVRDIVGYTFGKDIEYVQRKSELIDAVEELTSILQYEDVSLVDMVTAIFSSICGVGYQCTLPADDYLDETPEVGIEINYLDPRYTFVVQSYDFKNPVVLACNFYKTKTKTVYTLYDKKYRTTIINDEIVEHKLHGLSGIPITMFENNPFLLGDFEVAITILDALNKVASDSVNDIENFVQSLLVLVNATLGDDDDTREKTKNDIVKNRLIEIKSPQGLQADAKYITQQLNPETTANLREYLEECLWKVIGIPDRKTRSGGGGDTGDAVKLRDGWADIEVVARNKEKFFRKSKKQQLEIAISLLKVIELLPKELKVKDIDIKFSRNKSDNLNTKSQAYSVLTSTQTLDPVDALEIVDITTNVNEVINRGEKYWKRIQEETNQKLIDEMNKSQNKNQNDIKNTNTESEENQNDR